MSVRIRETTKDDVQSIYSLMQDMKKHLKNDQAPRITLENLYKDGGFEGGPAHYFSLLAEDTDVLDSNGSPIAVGFVLWSYLYSWAGKTVFLNDIYVKESHRSKGIGKLLYKALMKYTRDSGCERIEFCVFKSNPAQKFYEHMGAINATDKNKYIYYRVYREAIQAVKDD